MFYALSKLISVALLTTIGAIYIGHYILFPIQEYFWPVKNDSSRASLQAILSHRQELADMELLLQEYRPSGSDGFLDSVTLMKVLNRDFVDYITKVQEFETSSSNEKFQETDTIHLVQKHQALNDRFRAYWEQDSLPFRLKRIMDPKALKVMQLHFKVMRKYGVVLDKGPKINDEELEEVAEEEGKCVQVLTNLLTLTTEAEDLVTGINKLSSEVELKLNLGQDVSDIDISQHIDHFNTESNRLKDEMTILVRRNKGTIGKMSVFIDNLKAKLEVRYQLLDLEKDYADSSKFLPEFELLVSHSKIASTLIKNLYKSRSQLNIQNFQSSLPIKFYNEL